MENKNETKIKAKKKDGKIKKTEKIKKKGGKVKKIRKAKKAKKADKVKKAKKIPFSRAVIMSVLAFVMALGGYGGYKVVNEYGRFGVNFESRAHLVVEVIDGDTIIVEGNENVLGDKGDRGNLESDNKIRVRLLGINAPEVDDCFGAEAKQYLQHLLLGKKIILEKDQKAMDQYERLLRYAFVYDEAPDRDNIFVNEKLLRGGFVISMYVKPNKRYLALLQAAEREAQKEKVGLWEKCDYNTIPN